MESVISYRGTGMYFNQDEIEQLDFNRNNEIFLDGPNAVEMCTELFDNYIFKYKGQVIKQFDIYRYLTVVIDSLTDRRLLSGRTVYGVILRERYVIEFIFRGEQKLIDLDKLDDINIPNPISRRLSLQIKLGTIDSVIKDNVNIFFINLITKVVDTSDNVKIYKL